MRTWKISPVVWLWNSLLVIAVLLIGLTFGWDYALLIWGFSNVFTLAMIVEISPIENHLWIWLTPLMWLIILFGMTIGFCEWLNRHGITKFNNWFNSLWKKK